MLEDRRHASVVRDLGELIRLLTHADLPAAMALKEAAGWNQTEQDWQLLLDLAPQGCFCLECAGELAATATILPYGVELAWIGMVLTDPRFRGRGYARRLLNHAVEFARGQGIRRLGLDATDMGIGLYRGAGFRGIAAVERWERAIAPPPSAAEARPWDPDPALDLRAFGVDRMTVLARLAHADSASAAGGGYAMGRAGAKALYFGPCLAPSPSQAEHLLRWYLAAHPGETVYWDIPPENGEAVALAGRYGFRPMRRLTRMMLHLEDVEAIRGDPALIFAIAGFELG